MSRRWWWQGPPLGTPDHTHTMAGTPTGPYKDRTPAMQVDMHGQPTGEWAWDMGGQCVTCGEDMHITMIVRRDQ